MGYCISYEKGYEKKRKSDNESIAAKKYLIPILAILLVVIGVLFIRNTEIRHFILPGDGAVTEEAAKNFFTSLENGAQLEDAIAAFCHEIIQSAR